MNTSTEPFINKLNFATTFVFNELTSQRSSNSSLIALSEFVKNADKSYYLFLTDQYIKSYNKNPWRDNFFDYFDIEKFDKSYLSCLASKLSNNYILDNLKANNYNFQQHEFLFSLIDSASLPIPYDKNILYGRDVEAFFLMKIEIFLTKDLLKFLPLIKNSEDLKQLKKVISENDFTKKITQDMGAFFRPPQGEALNLIEKYESYLSLENSLEQKTIRKNIKI